MRHSIDLLEFIQCVLAKRLNSASTAITPCLVNYTGYYQIIYNAEPTALNQQLTQLMQLAVDVAKQQFLVVMSVQQSYLQLQVYVDGDPQHLTYHVSLEKISFVQPKPQQKAVVKLASTSERIQKAIAMLNQYSGTVITDYGDDTAHEVTLIDGNIDQPASILTPNQLVVLPLASGTLIPQHHNYVFWPFFDSDILLALQEAGTARKTRVLVADDSIPCKMATTIMLEKLGCKVTSAADGNDALTKAQHSIFDLIFLDERMPGLNGSDVARQLCEEGQLNRDTPKIALTGITELDEITTLFKKGITHYLEKPITKRTLEDFLQQWQLAR